MTTPFGPPKDPRTLGQLVADLSEQTSRLVRDEIELAKAEVKARAQRLGIGVGLLVAGGVLALYLLAAAIATAILGLATVWAPWLAALTVTVFLLVVTAILVLLGIRSLKKGTPPTPARAIENVQEDVAAVKEGLHS